MALHQAERRHDTRPRPRVGQLLLGDGHQQQA
jgi:hypothetical protein